MSTGYDFSAQVSSMSLDSGSTALIKTWMVNIGNALDGSIGTPNIEALAITPAKLSTTANPVTRWSEALPDCKVTAGAGLFTTGTTDSNLSPGIFYIVGQRRVVAGAAIQKDWSGYTSVDYYFYMDASGSTTSATASVGAAAPATPAGYTPINKTTISSGGTASTSTSLVRTKIVPGTVGVVQDYRKGVKLYPKDTNNFYITPGEIVLRNSDNTDFVRKRITATQSVNFTVTSEASSKWYFAYIHSSLDAEADVNFISSTESVATSVSGIKTYYKQIGWMYNNVSGNLDSKSFGDDFAPRMNYTTSSTTHSVTTQTATSIMTLYHRHPGGQSTVIFEGNILSTSGNAIDTFYIATSTVSAHLSTREIKGHAGHSRASFSLKYDITSMGPANHAFKAVWQTTGYYSPARVHLEHARLRTITTPL